MYAVYAELLKVLHSIQAAWYQFNLSLAKYNDDFFGS